MAYDPTSRLQSPLICLEGVPSSRALLALLMSEEPYGLKAPDRLEADVGDSRGAQHTTTLRESWLMS